MKKILFFHHYNSPVGAGLSFLHILKSINLNKYEVVVYLPPISGSLAQKIEELGITVLFSPSVVPYMHFNGSNMSFLSKRNFKNCCEINRAKKTIKQIILFENPDCVIVNSLTLFWVGKIAQNLRIKSICFHRETYAKGMFGIRTHFIKKQLSKYFDGIAFLSNFDMKQTYNAGGKYIRITDKVDVNSYLSLKKSVCRDKLSLPQNENLILYLGGMSKLKGPHVVVEAMKNITEAKLIFLQYEPKPIVSLKDRIKYFIKVILNKNLEHKVLKIIEKNNLQSRIIFRPATYQVEEYFVACDIVVFPSTQAHQARPIYEAGIARKPIIITDFTNTSEFLDSTNGWLFENGNPTSLSKEINKVLSVKEISKIEENYNRSFEFNNLNTLPLELQTFFDMIF